MSPKRVHDLTLLAILCFAAYWLIVKPILKVIFG